MAKGAGKPRCAKTGLTVPECSCPSCLEAMLREYRPALLAEEIRLEKVERRRGRGPSSGNREAA